MPIRRNSVSKENIVNRVPKFKMWQTVWLASGASGRVAEITIREDTILYRLNNIHSDMKHEFQIFENKEEYLKFHAAQFTEITDD